MEELARLYATLPNGGVARPVRRLAEMSEISPGYRVLSPESAFLTLDMLRQNPAPGGHADGVAWKTGTSNGFCDAWAIAVTDRYVLAVWVGNSNGRRNAAFVGGVTAGPLLFQMLDALRAANHDSPSPNLEPAGLNLRKVELCAVSGQSPTAACRHLQQGWFIPGVSPIAPCEIHREVLIDLATGLRVFRDDGTRELSREVYEFWPHDLLALFRQAGVPRRLAPAYAPDARPELDASGGPGRPRIISPRGDRTYLSRTADQGDPEARDRPASASGRRRHEDLLVRRPGLPRNECLDGTHALAADPRQLSYPRHRRSRSLNHLSRHTSGGSLRRAPRLIAKIDRARRHLSIAVGSPSTSQQRRSERNR